MKGCVLLLLWGFPGNASPAGCGRGRQWLRAGWQVQGGRISLKGCVLLLLWGFPGNASPAGCGRGRQWLRAGWQVPLGVLLENGS